MTYIVEFLEQHPNYSITFNYSWYGMSLTIRMVRTEPDSLLKNSNKILQWAIGKSDLEYATLTFDEYIKTIIQDMYKELEGNG